MSRTAFFWDERCFWHAGGNYALTLPVGDLVQPLAAGGLPESPETKRRLVNLMRVTGLWEHLDTRSAAPASRADLERIHPAAYLDRFKALSDAGGGEIGLRTPFGKGGYELAALSAGLASAALKAVLTGEARTAYALSRPPGHHCLPDFPNGFCLLANIAIAIEAARAAGLARRFAVIDWDVHHGNGTQTIFYGRDDVLTVSIHQEHNYPLEGGDVTETGTGAGRGFNLNIPLPPGCGDAAYARAFERIVTPAIDRFAPEVIVVACGFDASPLDPLAHMLVSAAGFKNLAQQALALAERHCDGRLAMIHEGGYSEAYVPFCGHAVIAEMAGNPVTAPDPLGETMQARQPNARMQSIHAELIEDAALRLGL